jgi:hypothetical protein
MNSVRIFGRNSIPAFPIGNKFVRIKRVFKKKKVAENYPIKFSKKKEEFYELYNDSKKILKKKIANLKLNESFYIFRTSYPDDIVAYINKVYGRKKFRITVNKQKRKNSDRSTKQKYIITKIS